MRVEQGLGSSNKDNALVRLKLPSFAAALTLVTGGLNEEAKGQGFPGFTRSDPAAVIKRAENDRPDSPPKAQISQRITPEERAQIRLEGRLELTLDLLDEERALLSKRLTSPEVAERWKKTDAVFDERVKRLRLGLDGKIEGFNAGKELEDLKQLTGVLVVWRQVAEISTTTGPQPAQARTGTEDLKGIITNPGTLDIQHGSVTERYLLQLAKPYVESFLDGKPVPRPTPRQLEPLRNGVKNFSKNMLEEARAARERELQQNKQKREAGEVAPK